MNYDELRRARELLGLTPTEAAEMLDTDVSTIRKIERDPEHTQHRAPPGRVVRLYKAYLAGYRPDDWPERLVNRETLPPGVRRELEGEDE